MAPNTPNAYPREELFRSARGPAITRPALVPPAPIQELTQSIRPEFQPVPTVQPMVRPAVPHPALQFGGPAPLVRSIGGPAITHQALVPPAPIQELTQSIRLEFQPVPTVLPMVRPHLLHDTIDVR
ncbi:hypothetical protein CRG98_047381 [Punica granatum]|uniref:Uncharacterized protein n=1 Tax=Punica granatum TaxID=22663 RepID=A0A2I0HKM1_PUNGR|nr:hypothetical protein CRG98_047381 [Punica granatum]